jgi:hypothetical protein
MSIAVVIRFDRAPVRWDDARTREELMNRRKLALVAGAAALAALAIWWTLRRGDPDAPAQAGAGARLEQDDSAGTNARRGRIDVARVARGAIAGTVRDPRGAPVAGAEVCGFAWSDHLSVDETRDPFCTATAADGRYRLSNLLPADYQMQAAAPGFAPGRHRDPSRRTTLPLKPGQELSGVDISLGAGAVEILGDVSDAGGGPVAGAWVYAFERIGQAPDVGTAVTRSQADGSFRMWITPGNLNVIAEADGYVRNETSAVAPGQVVHVLLTPESILAGRVVEAKTGAPIAGATVSADPDGWTVGMEEGSATTVSDEDGRFRLTRLPAGRYKPTAASAPPAGGWGQTRDSLLLGVGHTVEDVVIQVHPAQVVTGRVLVEGGPRVCPRGRVELVDDLHSQRREAEIEDGEVQIGSLLPGTYKVGVGCRGFWSDGKNPEIVVTADAAPAPQRWIVHEGGRLRGTVRSSAGEPVAGMSLNARPRDAEARGLAGSGSAVSDRDGVYVIDGLPPGPYRLTAWTTGHPTPNAPFEVTVVAGREAVVDIRLDAGGAIAGTLSDDRGRPIAGASVSARRERRGEQRVAFDHQSSLTRDDGGFELRGLHPGDYEVVVGPPWGQVGPGADGGQKVTVAAGKTASARFVVKSMAGVIRGKVVDSSGAPIVDAFVVAELESEGGRSAVHWSAGHRPVMTDQNGEFVLERLAEGAHVVRAWRRGGGEGFADRVAIGSTIAITIRPTGQVAGTVAIGGKPVESFDMRINDAHGNLRSERYTRAGGQFTLRDLPAGSYDLKVSAPEGSGSAPITLADGQNVTVAIELTAHVTISGRLVSLDDGSPLAGFRVSVIRDERTNSGYNFDSGATKTDTAGRFTIRNAPAGRLRMSTSPNDRGGSAYPDLQWHRTIEPGRTTVDVGDLEIPRRRDRDQPRGLLGIMVEPTGGSLQVTAIQPGSPAASADLRVGDVIASIDGYELGDNLSLFFVLAGVPAGTAVSVRLARGPTLRITAGPRSGRH